ncbi:hypothetical protein BC826DRAFT_1064145 [Russula brevipes]|nr:hypothetical protein BC826DRAFT_1064145 [Russula brevipes]
MANFVPYLAPYLSPSSEDTPMAPTPTQKPKGGSGPRRASPGDVELSVFDIHNIFRRRWFLSRTNLLTNVISAQKDEDGNISWVEFTPQYHSHLVKCAVALVPHPVLKVKKVMFVYILELLNREGHMAFFELQKGGRKANNAQKEKRCLARKRSRAAKREREREAAKAAKLPPRERQCVACGRKFKSRKTARKHKCPNSNVVRSPEKAAVGLVTVIPTVTGDLWDTNPSGPWFFHHRRTGKRMGVSTRKDAEGLLASGDWSPA